ncbi:glycosyl hydrolase family 18 protein [Paenibacillus sp.]|uniref:glycosyl hydrolase family 18 protein n=1 Tax=Paenibacillus sp. TaxID=58172 RepID=UPI00281280FD|nr:glycosyl hydrolase family 18 protein [Paenibacillus sp.]
MHTATVPPPRRKRRGRGWSFLFFLMMTIALLGVALVWFFRNYGPVDTRIIPDYGSDKPVFYQGAAMDGSAVGTGEGLKLPLSLLQEVVDPNIRYEDATKSVIIATEHRVLRMVSDQLTAWSNDKPFELRFPVEHGDDGVVYVPIDPILTIYGLVVSEAANTGIVTLARAGDTLARIEAPAAAGGEERRRDVAVRSEPTVRAPIVDDLAPGERAVVWGEAEGWYKVQTDQGFVGFADERSVRWAGAEVVSGPDAPQAAPYVPDRPMGKKIVLAWEQVYERNPDATKFGPMPGLNVVSPTWFHVIDGEGALENRADAAYVRWAHDRGYQVWALFSNNFDPDMTAEALSTYDRRMSMARQLVSWAQLYKLDGVNVDFENVHVKDGPNLTQFMRELTPLLHEAGLTVSIDVTFAGGSDTWSKFLDRKALGGIVDYMMVMAYDEHWASSPVAGSVASLPWVENGMRVIIEEHGVPAEKLLLGVPFYTRIWTEETVDGKKKVSSKAVGMKAVADLINEKGLQPELDEKTGQRYVQYEEDGAVKKIWIEDEISMKARAELARELGLAGVAAWSRNFANDTIWSTIDETLHHK